MCTFSKMFWSITFFSVTGSNSKVLRIEKTLHLQFEKHYQTMVLRFEKSLHLRFEEHYKTSVLRTEKTLNPHFEKHYKTIYTMSEHGTQLQRMALDRFAIGSRNPFHTSVALFSSERWTAHLPSPPSRTKTAENPLSILTGLCVRSPASGLTLSPGISL